MSVNEYLYSIQKTIPLTKFLYDKTYKKYYTENTNSIIENYVTEGSENILKSFILFGNLKITIINSFCKNKEIKQNINSYYKAYKALKFFNDNNLAFLKESIEILVFNKGFGNIKLSNVNVQHYQQLYEIIAEHSNVIISLKTILLENKLLNEKEIQNINSLFLSMEKPISVMGKVYLTKKTGWENTKIRQFESLEQIVQAYKNENLQKLYVWNIIEGYGIEKQLKEKFPEIYNEFQIAVKERTLKYRKVVKERKDKKQNE